MCGGEFFKVKFESIKFACKLYVNSVVHAGQPLVLEIARFAKRFV